MGTHKIPRDVSGESRILLIFSWKALGYTFIGAVFGLPFFFLFSSFNMYIVGIVFIAIFALIGFSIGTFTIPNIENFEITRKTAGLKIDYVIRTGIRFKLRGKKVYVYAKEEKDDE